MLFVLEPFFLEAMNGIVAGPWPAPKAGPLVVLKCLFNLGAGVHDEGSMLGDRLANWPSLQD